MKKPEGPIPAEMRQVIESRIRKLEAIGCNRVAQALKEILE